MRKRIMWAMAAAAAAATATAAVPAAAQRASQGYTFLEAVKKRNGQEVTDMLAVPGSVLVNAREVGSGEGALHIVTRGRDLTWLDFLLARGASPNVQDKEGETPLGLAAQLGWVDGAEVLLRRGAPVDLANNRGETPLILAAQKRDLPMVRLLLNRGADPKRTDNVAGLSALDYARQDSRGEAIARLMEEAGNKPKRQVAGPKL